MINVSISTAESGTKKIKLGRQGENEVRQIVFDLKYMVEHFGDGLATLIFQRNGDIAPYIISTTRSGNSLTWLVNSTDTAKAGPGRAEIRWYVQGALAKTVIFSTETTESISADTEIPDEFQSWYDAMVEYVNSQPEMIIDDVQRMVEGKADADTVDNVYAKKTDIPTKLSKLTNDAGYLKSVPSEYVTESELEARKYLTQHQDISGKADVEDVEMLESRFNNVIGQASDDAELIDIRVRADGKVEETAGEAVRKQVQEINDAITSIHNDLRCGAKTTIYETASGSIASFSDGADDMPLKSAVVSIEPIQEGTGDPSPDNVRLISGRTGLSVARSGKNLLDKSKIVQGSFANPTNTANVHIDDYLPIKGGETYVWYTPILQINGRYVAVYDSNHEKIGTNINIYGAGEKTFTTPENAAYFKAMWYRNGSDIVPDEAAYDQIELGSTATDYEPYKGNAYSVDWETEAGTVYSATLDLVSGKLVVDSAFVVYDGSSDESWSWTTATNRASIRVPLASAPEGRTPVLNCNIGKYLPSGNAVGGIFISTTKDLWYYPPTSVTDLASYRSWLSENNLQVVYALAEPVVYQLTPQEIRTLLGENNIWSDGGDISVEHPADTKMYIDQKITEAIAAALA